VNKSHERSKKRRVLSWGHIRGGFVEESYFDSISFGLKLHHHILNEYRIEENVLEIWKRVKRSVKKKMILSPPSIRSWPPFY